MSKRRVLVCGATGFIGRNVAERLAARGDLEVTGTYLRSEPYAFPGLTLVRADLRHEADVDRVVEGTDIIVQAAATTSGAKDIVTKPFIHVTDNAVMNSLVFRAAFEKKVKHVVFFSCTVMYPSRDTPVRETDFDANAELNRNYFGVGWTKVYLEKMSEFYSRLGGQRYTVIRHSNIYGPYDKYDLERSHVFGATVTKVMTATGGKITVWGTGEERRDLLHVDDLVSFVELAMDRQKDPFLLCNVGAGRAVSVAELVAMMVKASGRDLAIEHDLSKPTIKTALCLDCARARQALGWEPKVLLEDGIRRTFDWYRGNVLGAEKASAKVHK